MRNRRRSQSIRVQYAFIKAHRSEFDTAAMCRLLDVSRSRFYEWLRNPLSDRALEDQRVLGLIHAAYTASHGVYGARVSFSICEKRARPVASIVSLGL
jgi:putative transposase